MKNIKDENLCCNEKMSLSDFLNFIAKRQDDLPKQQQQVCKVILSEHDRVVSMTVEELASVAGVSVATVLRTISRLDYGSYTSFKEELKEKVSMSRKPLNKLFSTVKEGEQGDGILDHVINENMSNLAATKSVHLQESFPEALELMKKAKRISIVALRSTRGLALYFHSLLHQFMNNVTLLDANGSDSLFESLLDMDEDDLLIAIVSGSPRYTKRTIYAINYAHERNIPSVFITNNLSSPAVPIATKVLLAPQMTSHYSVVSLLTVLEALVFGLGKAKRESATERIVELSKCLVDYDISF